MASRGTKSLKNLIFRHEIAILFLVAVTGLIGGLSAYFWQVNSEESVRIHSMFFTTEQIRSELYAQIQEMIRARVLEEPRAFEAYPAYSRSISELFNQLRRKSKSRDEDIAIQQLNQSYRELQGDMNKIFNDPYLANTPARIQLLDPKFAQQMVGIFEIRYAAFKRLLEQQHYSLDATLELWAKFAPFVIPIPVIIAFLIVIYTRHIMRSQFIKPVKRVMKGAHEISKGNLEHKIDESGVEEVSELAGVINKMSTEISNNREALIENERQAALGSLIPVVAHNIRNPLASIRATAQLLEHAEDQKDINESKIAIIETIDRLGRWVNALVSYLHPLKPNLSERNASELIEGSLDLLKNKIIDKNINIVKQGWEYKQTLSVDPDLMEQALYCLLANAVEASPKNSEVKITLTNPEDYIEINILDSGPGLPFEPKPGNLEPGPSTKKFGTGLGIPIAYKICQKHGWNLRFNVIEGEGTEAIVAAPIHRLKEVGT